MQTKGNVKWKVRQASDADIPALERLIPASVLTLQAAYYSEEQMHAALGPVFGVDRQLIADCTYFVIEKENEIVGAGGWSKRAAAFGSDTNRAGDNPLLDPARDGAKIRAFFVHPDYARQGIGRAIMEMCEQSIQNSAFRKVEIVATLAGEPLYASFGYAVVERFDISLKNNLKLPVVRMLKTLIAP